MNNPADIRTVQLREFYPHSADLSWEIDNNQIYFPDVDGWAGTMATGLQTIMPALTNKTVLELGSGSLVHGLGLITAPRPCARYIGVDIANPSICAGEATVRQFQLEDKIELFESNLLRGVPAVNLAQVDEIFGCIPQMQDHIALRDHPDLTERQKADLAPLMGVPEDEWGLGLPAVALNQAQMLLPEVPVTLILAGRPPQERINDLFVSRGYSYKQIFHRIGQQDPGTPLMGHVAEEQQTGMNFNYYADPKGLVPINAQQAQKLIQDNKPAYHDLYIIRARKSGLSLEA